MTGSATMRHRIFVGGSSEELPAARAIRDNLVQSGHVVKLWNQGIFSIGKTAFESLLAALEKVDAAVFVFAPNDLVTIRGQQFDAVRDNVVFELGLFTGRLGRDRTFWVTPKGQTKLRIASDLLGVLPAEYEEPRDGDWLSALGQACDQIDAALGESARVRGASSAPLATDIMSGCIEHVNRAMQHITATVASRGSADSDCVEALPDDSGFVVHCGVRSDLTLRFGRIEDCRCDEPGSVIALPANEFFDDECVTDVRSALGSFVLHHFSDQLDAFNRLVANERQQLRPMLVERESNLYAESYGVGTSLWLDAPLGSRLKLILSAVTRKRVGEGLKSEPAYLFAAVRSISRIMNDKRLTDLHLPIFGAGHGDMDQRVALFCLALALATTPDIRQANLVVFRKSPSAKPSIEAEVARRILTGVVAEARR
jgi:hypothetical protein